MPKKLQKRFQDYLTKIKKPPPSIQFPSKKWMRACKHPETLSFAINNNETQDKDDDAATLSDIDEFLFENFRSLYLRDDQGDTTDDYERREEKDLHRPPRDALRDKNLQMKEGHRGDQKNESTNEPFWDKRPLKLKKRRPDHQETQNNQDGFLFESPRLNIDPPAVDLCGSHRFSVSPGRLSSSVQTSTTTTTTSEDAGSSSRSTRTLNGSATPITSHSNDNYRSTKDVALPSDCISVLMYSPNPGYEFKRSMHDMVEARLRNKANVDWNFMEELLFCYLNLNEKKSHRFILSAFADMVVDMRQDSDMASARSRKL
ncbi:transcription repressor OFP14 [Argentina anserina]|uniref:transcription repressor OFP14 n=1 Tax=Argentina anserina TaxID=57926 RepID=UPI0021764F0E|nr:transcription repressor OFP14 [Potentilla anserina]